MRRGQILVDLAGAGRLRELDHVLSKCPRDEILTWFSVRMFQAACLHNNLSTMRFMVDRGFDMGFSAVSDALHWLVKGANTEMDGKDILPATEFLVKEARMSPNVQRHSDYRTPLHLAVERGFFEAARRLVDLGADVNAVAKDDVMPLSLAEEDACSVGTVTIDRSSHSGAATTVTTSRNEGNYKHKQGSRLDQQSTRGIADEDHPSPREKGEQLTSALDPRDGIQRQKHTTQGAPPSEGIGDPLDDLFVQQQHRREKLLHPAGGEDDQRRIAEGRARICGLLVEHGARRTWRRAPSAKQIALDSKYSDLMKDDDGRNLCTFNG
ncbi:unnamed protein product [Sphacelaria rigidula]